MNKTQKFLTSVPSWSFSVVVLIIIVWLMDSSKPEVGKFARAVEGFYGVCHALMTFVFAFVICFDWQRNHLWKKISWRCITCCVLVGLVLTVITEVAQLWAPESLEHRFGIIDILWQAVGALCCIFAYYFGQFLWLDKSERDDDSDAAEDNEL